MRDSRTHDVADRLARALDGNDGDDLGLAVGEGALHLALDFPIREAIEDVYADCGDSTPRVLSTNIAQRLAYLLPPALIAAFGAGTTEQPVRAHHPTDPGGATNG
ncbi:MAG: hypothetical protein CMH34_09885 [Microbacterium sp.]|nr:hypothetical protein [Microbacterium sp.]|tara:strand:- start:889 stop:1203 length:315 start_codon:yes stop_codon:yes gene_type:complete